MQPNEVLKVWTLQGVGTVAEYGAEAVGGATDNSGPMSLELVAHTSRDDKVEVENQ